ncbi:putative pentatricopeptide repeat-containing protein At3g15130 [Sesamum indicum]|uniref:Pentatricopeptide repeat-containing protein At3g15130 n=1 Tax=Sesamum indicum TaxID=4182 RepID=A0A6I9TBL5_SESIN|nr:putative pentatricopeptide repeat-containing protein At3g15130 [Sesamum indicum]
MQIQQVGVSLIRDRQKLAELLRKCSQSLLYDEAKQVHGALLRMGYESDLMINNDLIDTYGKCGRADKAHSLFDRMPKRNVVSWTALMCGYLQVGNAKDSLLLYNEMGYSDVRPNEYTLSTNIKACGILGAVESGKQIHSMSSKSGFEGYPVVGNSIIDMYLRCRRIDEAEKMFYSMPVTSLITWNVMIAGYALSEGTGAKSLHFLQEMQKQGEIPDEFTLSSTLKACRGLRAIQEGRQIHAYLIRRGYSILTHKILAGSLIDLYAQCGYLCEAQKVFSKMEAKSLISWNALMVGYARQGCFPEAISLFRQLRWSSIPVDSFILSSIINVFADFSMVELGKQMHCYTVKIPSDLDMSVANSILDMYLKCGFTDEAGKYFSKMLVKNVVSYTVMITGYGKHGLGKEAVQLLKKMQLENIEPDDVTYLAVLSACSHSGLVEESQECFTKLCNDYRVRPRVEHYACMVDALGRAGRLKEAKNLIEKMPLRPNVGIWQTLLNACRLHKNAEIGREVGDILLRLDGDNLVNYVLISNMLADIGCWRECERLRGLVKAKGLKKEAGRSW